MFVSSECCVSSGRGLCVGLSFVQRSPIKCDMSNKGDRKPSPKIGLKYSRNKRKNNNVKFKLIRLT